MNVAIWLALLLALAASAPPNEVEGWLAERAAEPRLLLFLSPT